MAAVKDMTAGWVQIESHDRLSIGPKTYRNMVVWQRACAVCNEAFTIPLKAGDVTNSNFGLKNCKAHRGMKPGAPVQGAEFDELKKENAEYADAIGENLALIGQLRRENDALKAKLAEYELQPRMAAMQNKLPWQS